MEIECLLKVINQVRLNGLYPEITCSIAFDNRIAIIRLRSIGSIAIFVRSRSILTSSGNFGTDVRTAHWHCSVCYGGILSKDRKHHTNYHTQKYHHTMYSDIFFCIRWSKYVGSVHRNLSDTIEECIRRCPGSSDCKYYYQIQNII